MEEAGVGKKREQSAKGVNSVTKSTSSKEFFKRLLNKEEGVCERTGENMKKKMSKTPRLLER